MHEDEQRLLIKQMEDMRKGIYDNLILFCLLNLLLLLIVQEQLIIKLKKKEWECERTTMERVGLYCTVSFKLIHSLSFH